MASGLHAVINQLVADFVTEIAVAIRRAPLDQLTGIGAHAPAAPEARKRGRVPRADAEDVLAAVLALLRKHEHGLRAEALRAELGVTRAALARPIARGLKSGQLAKTGEKRATTYFVPAGGSVSEPVRRKRGRPKKNPPPEATTPEATPEAG